VWGDLQREFESPILRQDNSLDINVQAIILHGRDLNSRVLRSKTSAEFGVAQRNSGKACFYQNEQAEEVLADILSLFDSAWQGNVHRSTT
jgi:hypothetical protein